MNPSASRSPIQTHSQSIASGDLKRLNIVARVDSYSGYGIHLEQICRQLEANGILPTIRATKVMNPSWCPISGYLKSKLVHGIQPEPEELIIHTPDVLPTPGKRTFYWTMYECTNLPKKSVEFLNKAERVLVPSSWNASCFAASGVTTPISIVPLGVDPDVFKPVAPPKDNLIVFGCGGFTGNGRQRKGLDKIISAFSKAFPDRADVRLHVKCSPVCQVPVQADPRIIITRSFLSPKRMARWYQELNCFINIATGGWELMAHEAMACGIPVWAPRYGGIADFLDYGLNHALPYSIERAGDIWGHGLWASVPVENLVREMSNITPGGLHRFVNNVMAPAVHKLDWKNSFNRMAEAMSESGIELVGKPKEIDVNPEKKVTIVQLGKFGDIVNILPVARHWKLGGYEVELACSKPFASILKGVGYVSPVVVDADRLKAAEVAYELSKSRINVVTSQVCGEGIHFERSCQSFNEESWRRCGELDKFDDLPLVFDRRNHVREKQLWESLTAGKSNLLNIVAIQGTSESSPFDRHNWRKAWDGSLEATRSIIYLDDLKLDNPFDLIGVIDRCVCLVTVDTMHLHLAAATATPVVAFIADTPSHWHGTKPRCNAKFVLRYSCSDEAWIRALMVPNACSSSPRLIHAFADHPSESEDARRRNLLAERTWKDQHSRDRWAVGRFCESSWSRYMMCEGGRKLPFVRDILDFASEISLCDDEIIVLTNADTCMSPLVSRRIRQSAVGHGYRRDFPSLTRMLTELEISTGAHYPGSDIFFFPVSWWKQNRSKFPDMLLGAEGWDWCMRVLIGKEKVVPNLIYHERHNTKWESGRDSLPSQAYNRSLARGFLKSMGESVGDI